MPLIQAHDVRKTYKSKSGPVHALDGLNLEVPEGTVKALLGNLVRRRVTAGSVNTAGI